MLTHMEPQIIDGFTYSMNLLYLPNNYRSAVLAQLETIRLTGNYQMKMFAAPTPVSTNVSGAGPAQSNSIGLIPAYGQVEQQLSIDPGSYFYGWMFNIIGNDVDGSNFHIRVTDACTETSLSSDYILAALVRENPSAITSTAFRGPCLLAQPRLISDPGLVNVEIYNNSPQNEYAQLTLFCATPRNVAPPYSFDGNPGWHPNTPRGPQY